MPPVLPAMRCMLRSTKGEAIESVLPVRRPATMTVVVFLFIGEQCLFLQVCFLKLDILDIHVFRLVFVQQFMDSFLQAGNGLDAEYRRVVGSGKRLHDDEVIRHGLLVFQVHTVELGIRGCRLLHRLRVLALLRHLVRLNDHLIIAIAVEVTGCLCQVRQQRLDYTKIVVGKCPADAMA